jgi:hypothetical protein
MRGAVVVSITGLLGERFTARQDEKTLTLRITALGREIQAAYNLDGSESRNLNPTPGQPDEPIFSRASWEGDRLVILTRGTTPVDGKPRESKRVLWIDADGLLIERSADGEPTTQSVTEADGEAPSVSCRRARPARPVNSEPR